MPGDKCPTDGQKAEAATYFQFVKDISKKLDGCKNEIEANWRLQVFMVALGVATVLGWDVAVLKSTLGVSPSGNDAHNIRIVTRLVVALLLLFYFFRFGLLLAQYRNLKKLVDQAFVAYENLVGQEKYSDFKTTYTETNSQFEFYFKNDGNPVSTWVVLFYISVATSAMHAFGLYLVFDAFRIIDIQNTTRLFSLLGNGAAVSTIFYLVIIGGLYVNHLWGMRGEPLVKRSLGLAILTGFLTVAMACGFVCYVPS